MKTYSRKQKAKDLLENPLLEDILTEWKQDIYQRIEVVNPEKLAELQMRLILITDLQMDIENTLKGDVDG